MRPGGIDTVPKNRDSTAELGYVSAGRNKQKLLLRTNKGKLRLVDQQNTIEIHAREHFL